MLYRGNRIILTLLLVLTTMLAQAQSVYTIVEFLDEDAATAVFLPREEALMKRMPWRMLESM